MAGIAVCAAAMAGPPPTTPGTQQAPASGAQSPGATQSPQGESDEDFIEFLGADDVGDAAWWEFLKKAPPRGVNPPPATPPQDAKQ
ncbi:MAG: hypothetical protein WBF89_14485 [Steroidobacteraceae bacterium]